LGPLDHGRPISRSKVAHVISSQVIEGGKLEREGADRQDQEEGQVGGDGGKWINSGLMSRSGSTVPLLAEIAQEGLSRRGAMTGIHSKADPLKITPTHSVLLALPHKMPKLIHNN